MKPKVNENMGKPEKDEVLFEQPGAVMALKADALNEKPVFAIEHVATSVKPNAKAINTLVDSLLKGGYNLIFILKRDGWHLLQNHTDFKNEEVMASFTQRELQDLWLVHHPIESVRRRHLENFQRGENP